MQTTSATWQALAAADGTRVETRATINSVVYTGNELSPPIISRSLMQSGVTVGNVVSAMCTFSLDTTNTIPKSAEVLVEMRLTDGAETNPTNSEWLPRGTFYISRRNRDPISGIVAYECYDALLKGDAVWEPASSTWPQSMTSVVNELCTTLGLQLDSRTIINQNYTLPEPNAGATIRDILGIIGQYHGGNWTVTPENKLRLVPVIDASDAEEAASNVIDVSAVIEDFYTLPAETITGIRCTYSDATALIGDDTGVVVDVTIPAVVAADLGETLIGMTYQPFTLGTAYYDYAVELGDYVRYSDDVASVLYSEEVELGPAMCGNISAPDFAEIADEYPYIGKIDKALAVAKAYTDAAVTSAEEDFATAVADINSDIDDLQSQIDGNITTWFYAVDPTLSNAPAVDWTTTEEKNNHLGDLYYNTTSGYCWRFMLSGSVYSWQRISDTDITTALANAQAAQDTADSKRRVFVAQPTPPYDVGDLWVQGTSGDILKCVTAKTSGSYSSSDWAVASKYTDDTAVTALNNTLNQQEVFNRLTGNGAAQGIVLSNGQLYVNASYIQSGTLVLGGLNNTNGTLVVKDASNNTVGTWNNGGLTIFDTSGNTIGEMTQNGITINSGSIISYSSDKKYYTKVGTGSFYAMGYLRSISSTVESWQRLFYLGSTLGTTPETSVTKLESDGLLDIRAANGRIKISATTLNMTSEIILNNLSGTQVKGPFTVTSNDADILEIDGNGAISVNSPATMTGDLTLDGKRLYVKGTNYYTVAPASVTATDMVDFKDKNNVVRHRIYSSLGTDGSFRMYFMTGNTTSPASYAQIGIGLDSNNNPLFSVGANKAGASSTDAFKSAIKAALGLGTTTNALTAKSNFGGTTQVFGLSFVVDNSNNTAKNGHSMSAIFQTNGLSIYDHTDGEGVYNTAQYISLTSGTASTLLSTLKKIPDGTTAVATINSSALNVLTGKSGSFTAFRNALVSRDGNTYYFTAARTAGYIWQWSISNWTSGNPTIGNIYRFEGTQVT
ncbi:MAG: hypothetical protein J6W84_04990 [Bacteroidales bacterium]|nr:hypothetical protein [Bacteroidales bacterium]